MTTKQRSGGPWTVEKLGILRIRYGYRSSLVSDAKYTQAANGKPFSIGQFR